MTYGHSLAVLSHPSNTAERVHNLKILSRSVRECLSPLVSRKTTSSFALPVPRLSVVIRAPVSVSAVYQPSSASIARYTSDLYSELWDLSVGLSPDLLVDATIYPQLSPNVANERWIALTISDLECVVSSDSILGWSSECVLGGQHCPTAAGVRGQGVGGVEQHVAAINDGRRAGGLGFVRAVTVEEEAGIVPENNLSGGQARGRVVFLEDEEVTEGLPTSERNIDERSSVRGSQRLERSYRRVAVGGTFDGMHYGHRKLLTLAVGSVRVEDGVLVVGITTDAMLTSKSLSSLIYSLEDRKESILSFLDNLAPGLKNRRKVVPIVDAYGPVASDPEFDALVLSHEVLGNGLALNEKRLAKKMGPVDLLVTERTGCFGMSSTTLRTRNAASTTNNRPQGAEVTMKSGEVPGQI